MENRHMLSWCATAAVLLCGMSPPRVNSGSGAAVESGVQADDVEETLKKTDLLAQAVETHSAAFRKPGDGIEKSAARAQFAKLIADLKPAESAAASYRTSAASYKKAIDALRENEAKAEQLRKDVETATARLIDSSASLHAQIAVLLFGTDGKKQGLLETRYKDALRTLFMTLPDTPGRLPAEQAELMIRKAGMELMQAVDLPIEGKATPHGVFDPGSASGMILAKNTTGELTLADISKLVDLTPAEIEKMFQAHLEEVDGVAQKSFSAFKGFPDLAPTWAIVGTLSQKKPTDKDTIKDAYGKTHTGTVRELLLLFLEQSQVIAAKGSRLEVKAISRQMGYVASELKLLGTTPAK